MMNDWHQLQKFNCYNILLNAQHWSPFECLKIAHTINEWLCQTQYQNISLVSDTNNMAIMGLLTLIDHAKIKHLIAYGDSEDNYFNQISWHPIIDTHICAILTQHITHNYRYLWISEQLISNNPHLNQLPSHIHSLMHWILQVIDL